MLNVCVSIIHYWQFDISLFLNTIPPLIFPYHTRSYTLQAGNQWKGTSLVPKRIRIVTLWEIKVRGSVNSFSLIWEPKLSHAYQCGILFSGKHFSDFSCHLLLWRIKGSFLFWARIIYTAGTQFKTTGLSIRKFIERMKKIFFLPINKINSTTYFQYLNIFPQKIKHICYLVVHFKVAVFLLLE